MKNLLIILTLLSINMLAGTNDNEIIFYEEFSPLKSDQEIEKFSDYYQNLVNKNEPDTLAWKFFKDKDKVIAILRWKDSQAIIKHAENISEGGILEKDFATFNEHFEIKSVLVYGSINDEVKEALKDFGLPFEFYPLIAGYSR